MSSDPASLILHPLRRRSGGEGVTILAILAVIVGLIAMHSPAATMSDASMGSGASMGRGASMEATPMGGNAVAAPSTGVRESGPAASARTCECTTDRGCAEAMSSMACPLAPAPTHTLHAPSASLSRWSPPAPAGSAVGSRPPARPAEAPDLTRLSISRT